MCDFVPNIPAVYNGTLTFLTCLNILNCILYCITAFKVEKLHEKKKLSEVAVGGGGGSRNFRPSLKFYVFFNLSLMYLCTFVLMYLYTYVLYLL